MMQDESKVPTSLRDAIAENARLWEKLAENMSKLDGALNRLESFLEAAGRGQVEKAQGRPQSAASARRE